MGKRNPQGEFLMFQKNQQTIFQLLFAVFMSIIMPTSILLYSHGWEIHSFLGGFFCSFFITLAILNMLDMPLPGRKLAEALHIQNSTLNFLVVNGVTGFLMAFVMNFSMNAVQTGFDSTYLVRAVGTLPAAIPASTLGSIVSTWLAQKLAKKWG
jgi:hypothetical protein